MFRAMAGLVVGAGLAVLTGGSSAQDRARVVISGEIGNRLSSAVDRMDPKPTTVLRNGTSYVSSEVTPDISGARMFRVAGLSDALKPGGKQAIYKAGPRYQVSDIAGCRLFVLDSTLENNAAGYLDMGQLEWMDKELKRLKKGTSVLVFIHHGPSQLVNADEFSRVLAPHNVLAVFTGADIPKQTVNGIPFLGSDASPLVVDVDLKDVLISKIGTAEKPFVRVATLPRTGTPRRRIAFLWDDAGLPILQRRRALAELRVGDAGAHDDKVKAEYSIDDGPRRAMLRDDRDRESVSFLAQWETRGLFNGAHRLNLWFTAPDGELFTRQESFVVEQAAGVPRRSWEYMAEDGIQADVVADAETVIVADVNGRVTGLRVDNGKKRWQFKGPAGVVAAPALESGTCFVAFTDGTVAALESKSGKVKWKAAMANTAVCSVAVVKEGLALTDFARQSVWLNIATGKECPPAGELPPPVVVHRKVDTGLRGNSAVDFYLRSGEKLSASGGTVSLRGSGGQYQWTQTDNGGAALCAPLPSEGMLVTSNHEGMVVWRKLTDGKLVFRYACDPGLYLGAPAAVGKTVFVAGLNRNVVAVQLP